MKHSTILNIAAGIAIIFSGCSDASVSDRISSAELALANEDVSATREICGDLFDRKDRNSMEAKQMARLSILYMELNDRTDDPNDIEYAVQCYREAFKINSDSAKNYYESLPVDQDKYALTLSNIVHTLDNPQEIPEDHDCDPAQADSVYMSDSDIMN